MGVTQFSTMRRPIVILCVILTVAYFLVVKFLYQFPFSLSYFKDMRDAYAIYASDAEWMNDHGFMKGVDDWDFAPERAMTRAELCALLLRLHDIDVDKLKDTPATDTRFKDLDQTKWYPAIVDKADKMHILPFQVEADRFQPDAPVTRGEVAQSVADMFSLKATGDAVKVTDIAGNPHEDAIKVLLQHAYATGTSTGEFKPNDVANRAVVARIFHLALRDQKPELDRQPVKHQTPSNDSSANTSMSQGGEAR